MRFAMPNHPCDFELPDEWLAGLLLDIARAPGSTYRTSEPATAVALADIEPPWRLPSVVKDWRGFDRVRLRRVMERMGFDHDLDPVSLVGIPQPEPFEPRPYRFRVRNGYHRFYGSIAVGFDHLPRKIE